MTGNWSSSSEELDLSFTLDDTLVDGDNGAENIVVAGNNPTSDTEHDTNTATLTTNDETNSEDHLDAVTVTTDPNGTVKVNQTHDDNTNDVVDRQNDTETDQDTDNLLTTAGVQDDETFNDTDTTTDHFTSNDSVSQDVSTPEVGGTLRDGSTDTVVGSGMATETDGAVGETNTGDPTVDNETDTDLLTSNDTGTDTSTDYLNLNTVDPTTGFVTTIVGSDNNADNFTDGLTDNVDVSYGWGYTPGSGSGMTGGGAYGDVQLSYSEVATGGTTDNFNNNDSFTVTENGTIAPGQTVNANQMDTGRDTGSDSDTGTYDSPASGNGTETDTFSENDAETDTENGYANVNVNLSTADTAGNSTSTVAIYGLTDTGSETIINGDSGSANETFVGGLETTASEQDTDTTVGTSNGEIGQTVNTTLLIVSVDPTTGLRSTLNETDHGYDTQTPTEFEHEITDNTDGSGNDVTGIDYLTEPHTYHDVVTTTRGLVGTDANGNTYNLTEIGTDTADQTSGITDDGTLGDGSNIDLSGTNNQLTDTVTNSLVGTIVSTDPTSGVTTNVTLNESTTATLIDTAISGDTQTTSSSRTTDVQTASESGWDTTTLIVQDSTSQTNADGTTSPPQTVTENVTDTETSINGVVTDQGVVDNTNGTAASSANDSQSNDPGATPAGGTSGVVGTAGLVLLATIGADVGHHWVPQSVFNAAEFAGNITDEAKNVFTSMTKIPEAYKHGFDTWGVTHDAYLASTRALMRYMTKDGAKINANTANKIVKWISTGVDVPQDVVAALGENWTTITTWRKGFLTSIAIAETAHDIAKTAGITLTDMEAKAIAWRKINPSRVMPPKLAQAYSSANTKKVIQVMSGMTDDAIRGFLKAAASRVIVPALVGVLLSAPGIASAAANGAGGTNPLGAEGVAGAATGAADKIAQELVSKDIVEFVFNNTVGNAYKFIDAFNPANSPNPATLRMWHKYGIDNNGLPINVN